MMTNLELLISLFGITDFSIWEMQNTHKASWLQGLRWCFRILFKGSPYGDQVILEEEGVDSLIEFLKSLKK